MCSRRWPWALPDGVSSANWCCPTSCRPRSRTGSSVSGSRSSSEGALSFLGQSVPEPTSTWGKMIAEGSGNLTQNVSQLLAPAIAMFLTILAVNFIGDRLRGRLDARDGVL